MSNMAILSGMGDSDTVLGSLFSKKREQRTSSQFFSADTVTQTVTCTRDSGT